MRTRMRYTTGCVALALALVAANALAQVAPAPAPPAPVARAADDEDFDDEGVREAALGARSAMQYSCSQAQVYVAQKAKIARCWSKANAVTALATAAEVLNEKVCKSDSLPLDVEWAEQGVKEAKNKHDEALEDLASAKPADTEAATKKLDDAKKKLDESDAELVKAKSMGEVRDALSKAFDDAVDSATPQDFVEVLESDERKKACREVGTALRAAQKGSKDAGERLNQADAAAKSEPSQAHASDLLRKASTSVTAVTGTNGEVEHAGAPDTVALAIMSALGADKETSGSNVVMTLNLATIFVQDQAKRLELAPSLRNLFLRVTAPLESTEPEPATAATDEAEAAEAEPEVKRLNLVLGTSLLDSSDPRLKPNRECYTRVVDYYPPASTDTKEADRIERRKDLFDVCNRRAAYEQRLALRAGMSLLTDQTGDDPDTRPELYAGALVYAPAPWFYTNLLYQAIVEPTEIHVFGAGFSLGTNVGGRDSGVDSWSRVGLDTLFLVARTEETDDWDWEWRIVPTARVKIGDTVSQLGIGPRILGSGDGGVFATIALAYDVDALMDPLLTTSAAPGNKP